MSAVARRAGQLLVVVSRETLLLPLHVYRRVISPALPQRCRYHPSCSAYAVEAVRERGIIVGTLLAAARVVRCNPWSDGGLDPVPMRHCRRDHNLPQPPVIG